jgi:hypothetical protein
MAYHSRNECRSANIYFLLRQGDRWKVDGSINVWMSQGNHGIELRGQAAPGLEKLLDVKKGRTVGNTWIDIRIEITILKVYVGMTQ